eukprot:2055112-Lingulodinium_polyedra.AAC.1
MHMYIPTRNRGHLPVERALSYRRQPAQGAGERVPGSAPRLAGSGPAWYSHMPQQKHARIGVFKTFWLNL